MSCFLFNIEKAWREMYQLEKLYDRHIATLYEWDRNEQDREFYTCRPLHQLPPFDIYKQNNINKIKSGEKEVFLLVEGNSLQNPLGRIMLFDYNPRNHSKEIGYYIPPDLRGKGLGYIMLTLLLNIVLSKKSGLNKLYATTSSNNHKSIGLLEKTGFKLDGRLREHYWIKDKKFDQLHYSILQREWYAL